MLKKSWKKSKILQNFRKFSQTLKKFRKFSQNLQFSSEKLSDFVYILRRSGRSLKMLQNEPSIAAIGVDTAEKCTIEILQNLHFFYSNSSFFLPIFDPPGAARSERTANDPSKNDSIMLKLVFNIVKNSSWGGFIQKKISFKNINYIFI